MKGSSFVHSVLVPPSLADTWLIAGGCGRPLNLCLAGDSPCQHTWSGKVLTSWWDFLPHCSVALGGWIKQAQGRPLVGPTVMVGKVEYCNPTARQGSQPICSKKQHPTGPWALDSLEESSCTEGFGSSYVLFFMLSSQ